MGKYNKETNNIKQKTHYNNDPHKQGKRKAIERIGKGLCVLNSTIDQYDIKLNDIPINKHNNLHNNVINYLLKLSL